MDPLTIIALGEAVFKLGASIYADIQLVQDGTMTRADFDARWQTVLAHESISYLGLKDAIAARRAALQAANNEGAS